MTMRKDLDRLTKAKAKLRDAIMATPEAKWFVRCLDAVARWLNKRLGG